MYREDVDLAWRMRRAGWSSRYVPESVAYHHRGLAGNERTGFRERIVNRRGKRPVLSMLSTRNQYLMLFKNLGLLEGVLAMPWILFVEGRQVVYSFLFEPHVIKGVLSSVCLWPKMWRKRKANRRSDRVSFWKLNQWFR